MGERSLIEWTDSTWNPWRGCQKVSPGCAHCYMFRDQKRYGREPGDVIRCADGTFLAPLRSPRWGETRESCIALRGRHLVFTCSWSDFFHPDADEWRDEAWEVIRRTPRSTYQVLTKRPELIADRLPADWGEGYPNVWLGTSIENRRFVGRADLLRAVPAAARFISAEPLLGPLVKARAISADSPRTEPWPTAPGCRNCGRPMDTWQWQCGYSDCSADRWPDGYHGPELDLTGIDWVIVGGESGPGHRALDPQWVRDLRDLCVDRCSCSGLDVEPDHEHKPAFFFKQWGGARPESGGRELDGREWSELPPVSNREEQ